MFRRVLIAIAAVLTSLALAQPALAASWYSASSPLKVSDNGTTRGKAYGDFRNVKGVSARSYSWQQDARPGGNGIYVETKFWWYGPSHSCSLDNTVNVCWWDDEKKSTTNTTSGSWVADYRARYLVTSADRARGEMKICENRSWAHDPCSAHVLRSFAY